MGEIVILFFFALLTIGQGRVTIRDLSSGRAGWGNAQYAKDEQPLAYWTMAAIDGALFGFLCFGWLNGGIELLK
jgi:hypothetical protein